MAKSTYADRFQKGMSLLKAIQDEQLGRLASLPEKYRRAQLDEWNDLAQAEAAVKERYRGRYLFELLQNANDAIVDRGDAAANSELDARVRIELTPRSLLVANCGQPFGELNVRALCRLHNTTKTASKQIGHKGIGFKSVLEICSAPQVFSDIYSFRFDGRQFRADVEKIMGTDWKMQGALPTLRTPYPCYLNQVNPQDRKRIEDLLDDGFVTVIRLEWEDKSLATQVAERINTDLQPTLLLFLTAIQRIEIALPGQPEQCLRREERPTADASMKEVLLYREAGDALVSESRWLLLSPPARPVQDPSLVADLGEAWKDVQAARFALAIELDRPSGLPLLHGPSRPFYVYFPTEEPSGLRYIVHGDFYVGDDRKTLPALRFNLWLTEEICGYLAGDGMTLLKRKWGTGTQLIELLAPLSRPEREFSRRFMERYLTWLRESPFVPVDGGQFKEPYNVRFPPKAADETRFRALFPAAKLRGEGKWAYATTEVTAAERQRKPPFLQSQELGAEEITAEQVVAHLTHQGMPSLDQCREIIALFANWWDALPQGDRPAFQSLLSQLPIFPTGKAWLRPGESIVFQANLRPGVPDMITPPGFDFAIIRRDAYSEAGSRSNEYRFFNALGARDYSARDLIRDAILPVLVSPDALKKILAEHPDSVLAAYRFLFQYFQDERGSRELADRLPRVLLPAWQNESQLEAVWKPAGECYLGRVWPGGTELEEIYSGFNDCFFVRDIPGLDLKDDNERVAWASFLEWLGVAARPKIITVGRIHGNSFDPFGDGKLWQEYLADRRKDFMCTNTVANHGKKRYLEEVHALHHFRDLVSSGDVFRLRRLYQFLAAHWMGYYHRFTKTTVRCAYERCPRDMVEDYFLFALRHSPWLEATLGSSIQLLAPSEIWTLGETEPQDVRNLLPTLVGDLQQPDSREFRSALGFKSTATAQVEDYVRLLEFLVARYPQNAWPAEFAERSRRTPLTTTFNWVLERIQTGLVARGDKAPACPKELVLLAVGKGGLEYVARNDPRLVYPDNPNMETRWQQHCAYLLCNDDWRRLREWLEVPNLSSVVEAEWEKGNELALETAELRAQFSEALPFFLALALKRQPSAYERILSRLKRLNLHVVQFLTAIERIPRLGEPVTLRSQVQVHLELAGDTRLHIGNLYCTPDVRDNLDILGDYVAGYIEIAGLADAFVLLMDRDQAGRMRFVESKGVTPEMIQRARADLGKPESDSVSAVEVISQIVDRAIQGVASPQSAVTDTLVSDDGRGLQQGTGSDAPGGSGGGTIIRVTKDYPPLDTAAAKPAVPPIERPPITKNPPAVRGGGGGGTTLTLSSEEAREQLGKRGEEWAYASEKRRLAEMGFDVEKPEYSGLLEWVSAVEPASLYDIRSVDENLNEVYIEVKSSSDRNPVIHLSIPELVFALEHGERYWLYWVGNAAAEQPDPPECYRDFARWLREKKVTVDVDSLRITLRKPITG